MLEAFGIREENVVPTGVPMYRMYSFDEVYATQIKQDGKMNYHFYKSKKVILFAPTFRGNGHGNGTLSIFKIDFERLAKILREA